MISVIMGVYNGEKTVARAVGSILEGEYENIQFVIVDDGSTDGTYDILRTLEDADKRILLLKNEKREGLAYCLNKAVEVSEGEFIARQDAADFSYPNRLNEQVNFLKLHAEISFAGCGVKLTDRDGKAWGTRYYPVNVDKKLVLKYDPFVNASLMFRREALIEVGAFRDIARNVRCEDYDLIFRLYARRLKGANIPKIYMDHHEDEYCSRRFSRASCFYEYRVRKEGSRALRSGIAGMFYSLSPIASMLFGERAVKKPDEAKKTYPKGTK